MGYRIGKLRSCIITQRIHPTKLHLFFYFVALCIESNEYSNEASWSNHGLHVPGETDVDPIPKFCTI
jgi:hypothetical protein